MSKAVMISIRPKWCEKICNGKKTIEIRKTRPKMETPFKCYIYCTRDKHLAFMQNASGTNLIACMDVDAAIPVGGAIGNGKVIGEFTCEDIYEIDPTKTIGAGFAEDSCVSSRDIHEYLGGQTGYGWHISDLKIYDKPKELSEFSPMCMYKNDDNSCQSRMIACSYQKYDYNPDGSINLVECGRTLERPPQSWCYVEEVE